MPLSDLINQTMAFFLFNPPLLCLCHYFGKVLSLRWQSLASTVAKFCQYCGKSIIPGTASAATPTSLWEQQLVSLLAIREADYYE